jgi:hypothetical protein
MSIILPDATDAETASLAAQAAAIATAEAAFIASTTVLINDAIALGLPLVEPFLPPLVSSTYVTNYFTPLGYVVLYPIIPPGPYNPAFVPGFPEALPPNYIKWGGPGLYPGAPRIRISWGPIPIPSSAYPCGGGFPAW